MGSQSQTRLNDGVHSTVCKIASEWEASVQHTELSSVLCDDRGGRVMSSDSPAPAGLQPCVQSQGWKYCWLSTTSEQPPRSFQSRRGCTLSLLTAFLSLGLKPGAMIHQIHFTCLYRSRSCVSSKHHAA